MIRVTRMNGAPLVVNAELIESIEQTPDTVISLTTRNRLMVRETADEVVARVIAFYRTLRLPLDGA